MEFMAVAGRGIEVFRELRGFRTVQVGLIKMTMGEALDLFCEAHGIPDSLSFGMIEDSHKAALASYRSRLRAGSVTYCGIPVEVTR